MVPSTGGGTTQRCERPIRRRPSDKAQARAARSIPHIGMARLLNQKSAIKLLREHGWTSSVGGKHSVKMVRPHSRPITLPQHKGRDYSIALTRAILRQAGVPPEGL